MLNPFFSGEILDILREKDRQLVDSQSNMDQLQVLKICKFLHTINRVYGANTEKNRIYFFSGI